MTRRLTAAAAALALVGLLAPAAQALQLGASAAVTSPSNGASVSGTISVSGQGKSDAGVEKVELYVAGLLVDSVSPSGIKNSAAVSYSWDTTRELGGGGIAPNGEYNITVKARSKTGSTAQSSIRVYVNNPASTPTGVSASASGNTITVTWNANPEPDITGYKVFRDGAEVATVGSTSFSESLQPGTYSYAVAALRASPTNGTIQSDTSAAASATIEPPPAPETPGGGGGLGGGGLGCCGGSKGGSQNKAGGAFNVGGTRLAPVGLPAAASLPQLPFAAGLPDLPDPNPRAWGRFKETLPYDLPEDTGNVVPIEQFNIAARSPDRIIPPDGLRWVAAGMLALATAFLLWFVGFRVERASEGSIERIAVDFLNRD
jgi:hypothetical protein